MKQANDNTDLELDILQEAAVRSARLSAEDVTDSERANAAAWEAIIPEHAAAMADVERALELAGAYDRQEADIPVSGTTWKWLSGLAAAAVLAIIVVTGLAQIGDQADMYITAVGDQQTINLADGSELSLNTATELSVVLGSEERRVTLKRGEAFFDVAPDAQVPFVITTNGGEVRVLGTAFNVKTLGTRTAVSVVEGAVLVKASAGAAELGPGQQISFDESGVLSDLSQVSPLAAEGWRRGMLVYDRVSLQNLADDLSRYYEGRITVSDPADRDILVNAVLRIEPTRGQTLDTLSSVLPVSTEEIGSNTIALEWRDE